MLSVAVIMRCLYNQMYGDRLFIVPLVLLSRYYARTDSPIYTYEFSHVSETSLITLLSGTNLPYKCKWSIMYSLLRHVGYLWNITSSTSVQSCSIIL